MGANGVSMSYPGKTLEQAKKQFAIDQDQDCYENGHSYSGGIGMLSYFKTSQTIYPTQEALGKAVEHMSTNDALWAQVAVIRDTKPLIAARAKQAEAYNNVWVARNAKKAPSVIRTMQARYERAKARVDDLTAKQALKSKKTTWCVAGWASS